MDNLLEFVLIALPTLGSVITMVSVSIKNRSDLNTTVKTLKEESTVISMKKENKDIKKEIKLILEQNRILLETLNIYIKEKEETPLEVVNPHVKKY